jgi:hypothetical protein
MKWSDGFWNEWYLTYKDGRQGWLAEAQGSFMISFSFETNIEIPDEVSLMLGHSIFLGKAVYKVMDVKDVTYSFAQGELPFAAPLGGHAKILDLQSDDDEDSKFASISYGDGGEIDIFTGQYVEFEQFQFQNLRRIDGW